jgi:hypothetical protein
MTVEELQARLRAARSTIGYGRFALTLSDSGLTDNYLTHWHYPDQYAPEACKAVASGTVEECLQEMSRYAAANRLRDAAPAYSVAAE